MLAWRRRARAEPELRQALTNRLGDRLNRAVLQQGVRECATKSVSRGGEAAIADRRLPVERDADTRDKGGIALVRRAASRALGLCGFDECDAGFVPSSTRRP